jgi:hypothetical protein
MYDVKEQHVNVNHGLEVLKQNKPYFSETLVARLCQGICCLEYLSESASNLVVELELDLLLDCFICTLQD